MHYWNRRSFLNIQVQVRCTYLKSLLSYTCLFTTNPAQKPQEGGLIVVRLGTPLLADPVDKYAKISRRKHPFKVLYTLHNRLQHVCEISTEIAKHGRNRQPHKSLNSTSWLRPWGCRVKMVSLARIWDAKDFTCRLYPANLHC